MFQTMKAAWRAGRAGQSMPTKADKSTGQTAAICGITGITVLVVFGVAYGIGSAERRNKERLEKKNRHELADLKKDALAAKADLDASGSADSEEELDVDIGEEECEPRIVIDSESGEVREEEGEEEPEGAEDLWADHIREEDPET